MGMITRYRLYRSCGQDSLDAVLNATHHATLVVVLVSLVAAIVLELLFVVK